MMWVLTWAQEFSIEIPDKEADAIHSGTYISKEMAMETKH